jgi:hypothetical protein
VRDAARAPRFPAPADPTRFAPVVHRTWQAASRAATCALVLALAAPALAYVPPATAILKRTAQHREEQRLGSLEVRGTITFSGAAAERARSGDAAPGAPVPATLLVKVISSFDDAADEQ